MKRAIYPFLFIVLAFLSCEEVFFEDDISEAIIELISPSDNMIFDTGDVALNWNPLEGAEKYQLQIATPSFDMASQIILDTTLTKNTFQTQLSPNEYQWRVKGINSGYTTSYNVNRFQIVTLNPNEVVKLISPENEFISNNLTQQLSWVGVDYTKNYRLQIWKPNTSGEKIEGIKVQATDTLITFNEGEFIWQIRAENDENNTAYASRSILIDATAPNTPILQTPVNLEETINKVVQFSWERDPIEGSTEVDSIFIFNNETLTQSVFKERVSTSLLELELSYNTYYWYVKSYDKAGNKSERSEVFSFTILDGLSQDTVELTSPEDNVITNNNIQVLSWNEIAYAEGYRVQILKSANEEVVFDITIEQTEKEISFQDGFYNWQVKAQNSLQETEYTTRSILVDTKSPYIPTQISPTDLQEQIEKVVHFQYERQAIQGSEEVDSLFVYNDAGLNDLKLKTIVIDNNHYQEFEIGTYYWYLKSYDKAGNESEISEVSSFTISEDFTLKMVELTSPVDELVTNSPQQTLQWNAIDGALDYRVIIQKVNESTILQDYVLPITSKTISFEDGYYSWKVRAQNTLQNTDFTFRNILVDTTVPSISVLQSPTNEQVLTNSTVHFIWTRETVEGSLEKSTVEVYADVELTDPVFSSEASQNDLYKDMTPGTYYWFVQTNDEAGNTSEKSTVFSFTVQ